MSNNMGVGTANRVDDRYFAGGIGNTTTYTINKVCPACKKQKKAGQSHPKCSRVLQQMNRNGEI